MRNATLTLARLGYRTVVDVLPDPRDPELYARITLAGSGEPSTDDVLLFDQITRRRTNRTAFERRELPGELVDLLRRDAEGAGVSLVPVEPGRVEAVTELVMEADRLQMADPRFRRELAAWLTRHRRRDGMSAFSLEVGELRMPPAVTPLVARTFDLGQGRAAMDRQLLAHSGLLAAVTTATDDVPAWLSAGQALQTVLLRARAHGVWASFLDQPIELDELRPRLAALLGAGTPQLLLRLGYGTEPPPSHRRDPEDLLVY